MTAEYLGKIKLGSVASMGEAEKWAYLARNHEMALATVDAEGVIYPSPMWYAVRDRRIYIPVDQASKHVANVENGSPMSGTVFSGGDEITTPRGVIIQGRAEVVNDPELRKAVVEQLIDHVFGVGHPHKAAWREYREFYNNMTMEFIPEKMISWDMRKAHHFQMYAARTL